jgi:hypothetical protein
MGALCFVGWGIIQQQRMVRVIIQQRLLAGQLIQQLQRLHVLLCACEQQL